MIITCIILFVVSAMIMMCAVGMMAIRKDKKPQNKVHFYVAKDRNGETNLFLGKPSRNHSVGIWFQYNFNDFDGDNKKWVWKSTRIVEDTYFCDLGLNVGDFEYLKWEDEPVEVFLNLED